MTAPQRAEFRRALRDELATIRAINIAIRDVGTDAAHDALREVRSQCLVEIRQLLQSLHPLAAPRARARAAARIAELPEVSR
jgi:hypothetical protein